MRKIAVVIGLFVWFASADVNAAPSSVSFAGRLSTATGPVNGAVNVTFTIFNAQTGGSSVWTDSNALDADQGLVFATLGRAGNELDETVFTGAAMFLEIIVQGETLSPRLPINSTPYAVRSTGADSADLLGTLAPEDVVTTITAGPGLMGGVSGNPDGLSVGLGVNFSAVQSRVIATCPPGQSIRAIGATGGVTCELDSALTDCTWKLETATTLTTAQTAVCPAGKSVISGGCHAGGAATVLSTRPLSAMTDGTPITSVLGWSCGFSQSITGHIAYALCCTIN